MSQPANGDYRADYEERDQRITDVPLPAPRSSAVHFGENQKAFLKPFGNHERGRRIFGFVLLCLHWKTKDCRVVQSGANQRRGIGPVPKRDAVSCPT